MAKRIRISDDAGVNYYTFPGNTGQLSDEVGAIDDTIFGQDYASNQPGLIADSFQANAFFKGFAGYVATIKKSGSTTAFTAEAMTLVSGKTYKITNAVKNVWNRAVTPTVFDNAVNQTANVLSIDYLLGRITFLPGYTVTGPVTVTGSYFPTTAIASVKSFTLNMTANAIDKTALDTAQANSGIRSYDYGLKTVSLDLGGFFSTGNAFRTALLARSEVIIEVAPAGDANAISRGWYKPATRTQSGNVGDLEAESITYNLFVPDQTDVLVPFAFQVETASTLNTAVKKAIACWIASTKPLIQYLQDGTNGWVGSSVLTSITLSGGLEVMNEFAINGTYDGVLTAVP